MKKYFENKIAELRSKIEKSEDVNEVRSLGAEIEEMKAQLAKIEAEEARAQFNPTATFGARQAGQVDATNEMEARAAEFAKSNKMIMDNNEARAVLMSSGKLAAPTQVAGINDLMGAQVSSIVDLVKVTNAYQMGAYKVPYQKSQATAGTQVEGGSYTAGEPTFDFVTITPTTETVLSSISKQAQKQTPVDYRANVEASARIALKKRAAQIVTTKLLASTLNTALSIAAIDAQTLRKIALGYGNNESVVGAATLFLNKLDLIKFGDVRGSNEKKAIYEITPNAANPNTGIIREGGLAVPYCLDANLAEGKLVYGQPKCFELALFSDYEILVSEDFAFDKGMLTIRGDVELGGDVVVQDGFVVATVGAAA